MVVLPTPPLRLMTLVTIGMGIPFPRGAPDGKPAAPQALAL